MRGGRTGGGGANHCTVPSPQHTLQILLNDVFSENSTGPARIQFLQQPSRVYTLAFDYSVSMYGGGGDERERKGKRVREERVRARVREERVRARVNDKERNREKEGKRDQREKERK